MFGHRSRALLAQVRGYLQEIGLGQTQGILLACMLTKELISQCRHESLHELNFWEL